MATAPAVFVSMEEYLNSSYEGAFEYIDGEVIEKGRGGVTGYAHGVVQIILGEWFRAHRKEWNISCSVETHTRTSSSRIRLPDVVVVRRGNAPKHTIVEAPVLAIEVLSPSDTFADLRDRAADLEAMGVPDVWLIDPERRSASVWAHNGWTVTTERLLRSSTGPAYVDLDWLWTELDDSQ